MTLFGSCTDGVETKSDRQIERKKDDKTDRQTQRQCMGLDVSALLFHDMTKIIFVWGGSHTKMAEVLLTSIHSCFLVHFHIHSLPFFPPRGVAESAAIRVFMMVTRRGSNMFSAGATVRD